MQALTFFARVKRFHLMCCSKKYFGLYKNILGGAKVYLPFAENESIDIAVIDMGLSVNYIAWVELGVGNCT